MSSGTSTATDLITFTIKINGKPISGTYEILSIVSSKAVNRVASARIIIRDGDPSKEDFPASNSSDFIPGNTIEITAGYHSKEDTIFKGIIIKQGIQVHKNKGSVMVVECKDEAVKLTVGRKNAYFIDKTDSDAITTIVENYALEKDISVTSVTHKKLIQFYTSDWDFVVSRAEANGQIVFTDDGKISVSQPDISQSPVLSLTYGTDIFEFEAEVDARYQYNAVTGNSWDYSTQKVISSSGTATSFKEGNLTGTDLAKVIGLNTLLLQHAGTLSDQELKAWANAQFTIKSELAKIRGYVKFQGNANVKPGNLIELKGVGDRFNGNAYVATIRHEIAQGSWITDAQFGLSPEWFTKKYDTTALPAAGLLPAISGLQIGTVMQIYDDPDGENRIQITLPIMNTGTSGSETEEGIWARIATLDAGKNRGTFFLPEVGDEVIIGFINDDPRNAVVLGMLNSSARPAPLQADEENDQKGYVSREQLKLIFDDNLKNVALSTPAGNTLTLSEEQKEITIQDQNENKITMAASGITLKSAGDINISAAGNVKIGGVDINISADAKLTATGSAEAQFSADGETVVKGAMVKIN